TVPLNVDLKEAKKELKKIEGVLDIHHFHVWTLNSDCIIGTVHVRILHNYRIHSLTIQLEHEHPTEEYDNCVLKECCKFQCCSRKYAVTANFVLQDVFIYTIREVKFSEVCSKRKSKLLSFENQL
ncbi:cation efflux : zinc transporter, partial [Brachionus plicatilis]